jgi:hypothetical protein
MRKLSLSEEFLEDLINIFPMTNIMDLGDMVHVVDFINNPKSFCSQRIITRKFSFKGFAQIRVLPEFLNECLNNWFYLRMKRSYLLTGGLGIQKAIGH